MILILAEVVMAFDLNKCEREIEFGLSDSLSRLKTERLFLEIAGAMCSNPNISVDEKIKIAESAVKYLQMMESLPSAKTFSTLKGY